MISNKKNVKIQTFLTSRKVSGSKLDVDVPFGRKLLIYLNNYMRKTDKNHE